MQSARSKTKRKKQKYHKIFSALNWILKTDFSLVFFFLANFPAISYLVGGKNKCIMITMKFNTWDHHKLYNINWIYYKFSNAFNTEFPALAHKLQIEAQKSYQSADNNHMEVFTRRRTNQKCQVPNLRVSNCLPTFNSKSCLEAKSQELCGPLSENSGLFPEKNIILNTLLIEFLNRCLRDISLWVWDFRVLTSVKTFTNTRHGD